MSEYVSTADAAARLGVSVKTLRGYVYRGLLRGYRIHGTGAKGQLRFRIEDVDAMLEPLPEKGGADDA